MKRYCIVEKQLLEHHAGAKARTDIAAILISDGWSALSVQPIRKRENVSYIERLKMCVCVLKDWSSIARKMLLPDDEQKCLLIQYPLDMYPKVAMLSLRYIKKIHDNGVKIGFLIHDIESLRTDNENEKKWYKESESEFFKLADFIIAHNQKMIGYLENQGVQCKMYAIELFDYLLDESLEFDDNDSDGIVIAGNLSKDKAGYLYKIKDLDTKFVLYGPNVLVDELGNNMVYKGSFPPEQLSSVISGKFGLVWDGNSTDKCSGSFGEYMKYNNPHKTSLYLACNIPVIVWKKAAIAEFVKKNNVGICIDDLSEIQSIITAMSENEYAEMKHNARKIGAKLRKGEMFKKILRNKNFSNAR